MQQTPSTPTNDDESELQTPIIIDEALNEHIGFGKFQMVLLQICGSGWTYDGIEMVVLPFILPHVAQEWGLSPGGKGLLGAIVFLGMAIGAYIGGIVSDRFGRKVSMVSGMLITSLFGFMSAFSSSYQMFLLLRMCVGLGLGSTVPTDYSMLMEFIPEQKRASFVGLINMYYILGNIIECLLAWIILQNKTWRWLVAISSASGIVSFGARWFIPESPRFLLVNKKDTQALKVLQEVALINKVPVETCPLFHRNAVVKLKTTRRDHDLDDPAFSDAFAQLKMIVSPKLLNTSLLLWLIWFLLSLGSWGFMFLIPIIFNNPDSKFTSYVFPLMTYAVALVGYYLFCYVVDKYPRKTLAFYAFIVTGILTLLMGVMSGSPALILIQSIIVNFVMTSAWSVMNIFTPELYPTRCRTTGLGVCNSFTRIGGVITPLIGQILLERFGMFLPYLIFGLSLITAGICVQYIEHDTFGMSLQDEITEELVPITSMKDSIITELDDDEESVISEAEEHIHSLESVSL